ncbi:MAG: hypothetical protein ABIT83_15240, partial [Massilia sp.]
PQVAGDAELDYEEDEAGAEAAQAEAPQAEGAVEVGAVEVVAAALSPTDAAAQLSQQAPSQPAS